jgi:FtsP/CotA-like multicopper oxidase with cupredoxin domain
VKLSGLLMGPAERADVIVDFAGLAGQTVRLLNFGPDEPFGGGDRRATTPLTRRPRGR